MSNPVLNLLEYLGACDDSVEWVKENGYDTWEDVVANCPSTNWFYWLLCRMNERSWGRGRPVGLNQKALRPLIGVLRLSLQRELLADDEDEVKRALIDMERWVDGGRVDDEALLGSLRGLADASTTALHAYLLFEATHPEYGDLEYDIYDNELDAEALELDPREVRDAVRKDFATWLPDVVRHFTSGLGLVGAP